VMSWLALVAVVTGRAFVVFVAAVAVAQGRRRWWRWGYLYSSELTSLKCRNRGDPRRCCSASAFVLDVANAFVLTTLVFASFVACTRYLGLRLASSLFVGIVIVVVVAVVEINFFVRPANVFANHARIKQYGPER